MMKTVFWLSVVGVLYPYIGYPALLWIIGWFGSRPLRSRAGHVLPSVSLIVPMHNEESRVARKLANIAALTYPYERLQVLIVSDGSTDRTVESARRDATDSMSIIELPAREGKAAALNEGLRLATGDILVFSDASIELQPDALDRIVGPFADAAVGCVSGEDRIPESAGEGLYGRYELLLRRLESRTGSIVGASGSFYAQRRTLCEPFQPGLAPDFLSVLRTVRQGFRAVSEPSAVGTMRSVQDPMGEFDRKVRTVIRGISTLFANAQMLNPLRFGVFSLGLVSHKLLRWLAPFFLLLAAIAPLGLLDSPWYLAAFLVQMAFYAAALVALNRRGSFGQSLLGRAILYFATANAAILVAWFQYARGVRQELWTPTRRA